MAPIKKKASYIFEECSQYQINCWG